jgi:putative transposase
MADSVRILPTSGDYLLAMPRNARCVLPGHPYHVTQRGTDRQTVFRTATDYKVYLALLREQLRYVEVSVHAWCLMRNHVHLVVTPHEVEALAFLFRRVHGRYAQYFNAKHHRTGHLWQNRFYSCILAGSHVRKALRYVERNPVRAEIAERPADYRWSSAAAHLTGKDPFGVLDWSEWERLGKAEGWAGLLATPEEREQMRLLRRCTYAGRPFGEEEFLAEMEEQFDRKWRSWGFEGKEMNKIAAAAAGV